MNAAIFSKINLSLLLGVITFLPLNAYSQSNTSCRPPLNKNLPQFVIGYGSLMWEQSKTKGNLNFGPSYPIQVDDFFRGWIQYGNDQQAATTYLGVVPQQNSNFNGVYFAAFNPEDISKLDERENIHCRMEVPRKKIKSLTKTRLQNGQYWIYTTENTSNQPTENNPILQSYLDNFLSGCFELEEKFRLKNFARNCIQTTGYWSKFWVNDRANPRTPFVDQSYVTKIDGLIKLMLPEQAPTSE